MGIDAGHISAARAHIELVLLSSRTDGLDKRSQFLRLTNRGLPQELISRLDDLWDLNRACGGHVVRVGPVLLVKIFEFVDAYPEANVGMAVAAATKALVDLVPFTGPFLAPVSAVLEAHRFGGCFEGTDYEENLCRSAKGFVKLTADVLNANSHFFRVLEDVDPDFASFEDFTAGDVSDEENLFDLEEESGLSAENELIAKYLIRIALAEGGFDVSEKAFVSKTMEGLGVTLSAEQLEDLEARTAQLSIGSILAKAENLPDEFKERLLLLGMLSAGADNRIDVKEKKVLAESLPLLGISRERYSDIARNALAIMKKPRETGLSKRGRATVMYLVKISLLEGAFEKAEKQFVRQVVQRTGEVMTESEFHELITEASRKSLKDILSAVGEQSEQFREKLLLLAMLVAARDGSVDAGEKRALAQSLPLLGISKETYARIAKHAMARIRDKSTTTD